MKRILLLAFALTIITLTSGCVILTTEERMSPPDCFDRGYVAPEVIIYSGGYIHE